MPLPAVIEEKELAKANARIRRLIEENEQLRAALSSHDPTHPLVQRSSVFDTNPNDVRQTPVYVVPDGAVVVTPSQVVEPSKDY